MTLDTARLTIAYSGGCRRERGPDPPARRRRGHVTSPSEKARGDFGVFDLDRKLITLIGNVRLVRGSNLVSGARLVIDINSAGR